jgi:ribosomal subunit interface protein
MQAIQITIRALPHSDSLENHVRKKAEELDDMYRRISTCRVIIDHQNHKHQGKLFKVCIDVKVPGKDLVVNHKKNEDVYIAIRDAFNAIYRQLETYIQKHRGDVKRHTKLNGYEKEIAQDGGE